MKPERSCVEFLCPRCGGSYFSSTDTMSDDMLRHCEGQGDGGRWTSCTFTWRQSEDWRYFARVEASRFESREEFERAYRGEPIEVPG